MIRQSPDQGDRGEGHRGADGRVQRPHGGRACNDGHTKRRPAARQGGQCIDCLFSILRAYGTVL